MAIILSQTARQRLIDDVDSGCYNWLKCVCAFWPRLRSLIEVIGLDNVQELIIERLCCGAQEGPAVPFPVPIPIPDPSGTKPTPGPIPAPPMQNPCVGIPDPDFFERL